MAEYESGSGYGKRPLWQWFLIYLVVGAVIYGLIYYFVIAKREGYGTDSSPQQNLQQNGPGGY